MQVETFYLESLLTTGTGAQKGCGISVPGGVPDLTRHAPEQIHLIRLFLSRWLD